MLRYIVKTDRGYRAKKPYWVVDSLDCVEKMRLYKTLKTAIEHGCKNDTDKVVVLDIEIIGNTTG